MATVVSKPKYFLFSKEQMDMRVKLESKINRLYIPGDIIIAGKKHRFTEISDTENSRFKDAILIARVDNINSARYSEPRIINKA